MALRLRGLGLAMIALGIVLLPAIRSERQPEPGESQRRVRRLGELRGRHSIAHLYWTAVAERDSGAVLAERAPPSPTPHVILRGFSPRARAFTAGRLVDSVWKQVDRVDPSVRVSLVIYNGAAYSSTRPGYSGTSISPTHDGISCAGLVPSEEHENGEVPSGQSSWERDRLTAVLAPCLLLARFGAPGREIGAWLSATRYQAAGSSAWLDRPREFIDGDRQAPWVTFRREDETEETPRGSLLLSGTVMRWAGDALGPPYRLGGQGLRCATGHTASCRAGVLASERIVAGSRALPADLTYRESMLQPAGGFTLLTPRRPGYWWLSDLIRDQGRERFASFWKSDKALDAAFQSAFGEELGAWTHRWTVRQWENSYQQMYSPQPLLLGATLAPSWALLVVGWSGVALLLTAWSARTRQVG